jgi:1-acyl-sn-glycerol-3-phosphate acyltransferase
MFPEGRIVTEEQSVLNGGKIRPGVFGFARAANCPVIPAVILGTRAYSNTKSWAPLRKTVYGLIYGEPLIPDESWDDVPTAEKILRDAYAKLHAELLAALGERKFV